MTIKITKDEIRALVGLKRKELDETTAEVLSDRVQDRVLNLDKFMSADVVACYIAVPGEVRTNLIISACKDAAKTVCVPAYNRNDKTYQMVKIDENSVMGSGPMGILEPMGGEVVSMDFIEAVLVPGVAFDAAGRRVGHGGGHYDRLLGGSKRTALKLGLGFEFQVFDKVPWWEHDINMDLVVTENRVIRCSVGSGS
jgi:5-formyltetrahydrofolate cyclo-ligase